MNESETTAGLAKTAGYRYADRVAGQLYVAGQVPHNSQGNVIDPGEPRGQATQCLRNLKLLLEHHEFSENDIRHLTVYVVGNRECLTAAWTGVKDWFGGEVPPATLLGVSLLGYEGQVVELDATVVRNIDASA